MFPGVFLTKYDHDNNPGPREFPRNVSGILISDSQHLFLILIPCSGELFICLETISRNARLYLSYQWHISVSSDLQRILFSGQSLEMKNSRHHKSEGALLCHNLLRSSVTQSPPQSPVQTSYQINGAFIELTDDSQQKSAEIVFKRKYFILLSEFCSHCIDRSFIIHSTTKYFLRTNIFIQ